MPASPADLSYLTMKRFLFYCPTGAEEVLIMSGTEDYGCEVLLYLKKKIKFLCFPHYQNCHTLRNISLRNHLLLCVSLSALCTDGSCWFLLLSAVDVARVSKHSCMWRLKSPCGFRQFNSHRRLNASQRLFSCWERRKKKMIMIKIPGRWRSLKSL